MKLDVLFEATTPWRKLGNHKGVFHRVVDPADEARKKEQKATDRRAAQKAKRDEKLLDKLLEPIDPHDVDFDKVIKEYAYLLGDFESYDLSNYRNTYTKIGDVKVAALTARLMYSVNLADMYDQATIDQMYDGRETVEDSVGVTFYRSPANPKKIEVTY